MGKIQLTEQERAALASGGLVVGAWTGSARKQTWYDKHGRAIVLPAQPDMDRFREARGLSLAPPSNPEPYVEADEAEGFIQAGTTPAPEQLSFPGMG